MIPASPATTTAKTINVANEPLAKLDIPSSSANIAINEAIPATAVCNLVISFIDASATTDAANNAITTASTVIVLVHFLALDVAYTINAIIEPNMATAVTPLASPSRLTIPRRTETPANIAIANENATMILAACAVFSLLDIVVTFTSNFTNNAKPTANAAPFAISLTFSKEISLQSPTIRPMANEIDNTSPLIFWICASGKSLEIRTSKPTNTKKPPANNAPLAIAP